MDCRWCHWGASLVISSPERHSDTKVAFRPRSFASVLRVACVVVAALFVWPAGTAEAASVLRQNTSASGTSVLLVTTASPSWGSATTAGNLLVAVLTYNGSPTITATGWTLAGAAATQGTNVTSAIYYIQNAPSHSGAQTFMATGSLSAPALSVQMAEYSGIMTSGALDLTGTASATTANSITVATGTGTTTGPELAIAAFAEDDASNSHAWGGPTSPFADINTGDITSSSTREHGTYQSGTAPITSSTISTTLSLGNNKTANMAAVIATFKESQTIYYWIGAGSYSAPHGSTSACSGFFDDAPCWSLTTGGSASATAPTSADSVVFDGNGLGNCTLNPLSGSATQIYSITAHAAYTGTITQAGQNLSMAAALTLQGGTFVTGAATLSVLTNKSGTYDGDLNVQGGTFTGSGAVVAVRSLNVSSGTFNSGSSAFSTNNGGTVTLSGGNATFGSGLPSLGVLTISGATTSFGTGGLTASSTLDVTSGSATFASTGNVSIAGLATLSGGTVTFGGGTLTLSAGLTVSGATVTLGAGLTSVTGTATVSSGSLSFTNGASNPDFTTTDTFTQSGGSVSLNAAQATFGSTVTAGNDGFTMTGGTFDGGTGTLKVTGSSSASGASTTINGASAVFSGASGTQNFAGPLNVTSGAMSLGTASMTSTRGSPPSNANNDKIVTVSSGGTLTLGSAGFAFACTNTMTMAGTLNAGSGTVTFSGAVTLSGTFNANTSATTFSSTVALSGTFNANSSTAVTFSGAVTMSGSSAFNGNTGSGTFSVAPTLTAGTFTVGDSGTTGKWTFTLGATFTSGMALTFPANGGELATASGQTISVAGHVNAATTGTKPKIDCPACTTNQGFTMTFTLTATLNIDGLQFDHVSTAGVQIADGATYTTLKNLKFTNNAAGGTSSGTHLAITKSSSLITVPGCYFDATAQYNVTLSGVSGSTGVRAIFEFESTTVNGARAGKPYDLDSDTNGDNVADSTTSPRFGSVVEWVGAMPTDTAGTAVGFPLPAFDWNTFTFYGIYVAYKDTAGAGSADILWLRNNDGSPAYSYSVPQTSGDIVGTPFFDTVNEVTAGVDANGNGNQTDTDVRIAYIGTTTGHIIKLVDTGSGLVRPTSGPWSSDFTSASVATITSPLIEDGVNLYFGGTDGSAATKVFGVQVAGGANEKTLQKNVGSVSAVTTTPAWSIYSGTTYVFLGSTATSNQAYIYRIDMSAGVVDASFNGPTSNVNDSVVLSRNRAYAVTDGGKLYVLDASNFGVGGFTNLAGSPYVAAAAKAIKSAPWVDYTTGNAYFGDDGGNLYAVTSAGANLNSGYPFVVSASIKLSSSPMYRRGGGVIAVGGNDGYVYFVDRNNMPSDTVVFGSHVRVKDLDLDEEETFQLVGPGEEDYNSNKILTSSPIAQGLLGKKKGDVAEIQVPMGKLRFEIVSISFE